jgi:hypothetical protein
MPCPDASKLVILLCKVLHRERVVLGPGRICIFKDVLFGALG